MGKFLVKGKWTYKVEWNDGRPSGIQGPDTWASIREQIYGCMAGNWTKVRRIIIERVDEGNDA